MVSLPSAFRPLRVTVIIACDMESATETLLPTHRARFDALLSKRWALPGDHPLAALHGAALGDFRLLVLLGPKSSVGSQSFQLLLADRQGRLADPSLAIGLYNRGPYPAYNWVELTRYDSVLSFEDGPLDLAADGLDLPLLRMLSSLVPSGGHVMVEYDSPSQRPTERMLALGYPPVVTPIGYRLFQVGCRSFKNWHISEGWREGPRKLQCFKPLNDEVARERRETLRAEVEALLSRVPATDRREWEEIARRNGGAVAEALRSES